MKVNNSPPEHLSDEVIKQAIVTLQTDSSDQLRDNMEKNPDWKHLEICKQCQNTFMKIQKELQGV